MKVDDDDVDDLGGKGALSVSLETLSLWTGQNDLY